MTEAASHKKAGRQDGFVLLAGLMFLVVVTLLGVAMFRSTALQERIAGNTREKARALEAAQSALQYAEWWLTQGDRGTGSACNAVANANDLTQMQVCSNALSGPASLPWAARADYLPPLMTVSSGGGTASGGDINYVAKPGLYISYLGLSPDGKAMLYQVTGFGYGGSASTAAVVQSTFRVGSDIKDLGTE